MPRLASRVGVRALAATATLAALSLAGLLPGAAVHGARLQSPAPALAEILDRAATYVQEYKSRFSAVVSEEKYTQQVQGFVSAGAVTGWNAPLHRTTRSDILLVSLGPHEWIGFRDVFEVNGTAIRDHDQRLQKLFLETPGLLIERASKISDESARFNLGSVLRTINLPVLALQFLDEYNLPRSEFKLNGNDKVRGIDAAIIRFTEQETPSIIRDRIGNSQLANGRFWIDPASGRVLRSVLRVDNSPMHVTIDVTYESNAKVAMWVPTTMRERYEVSRGEMITTVASYSNFRKFSVDSSAIIK